MAQQETSALFSLKELMRLEQTRLEDEQELCRRQAESAEHARKEAEQAARERELCRLRLEDDRRRDEEARQREQEARIESVHAAEVERARVEALERERTEAAAFERTHEQTLAAIGLMESKKRLRRFVWLGPASAVLFIAVSTGLYFGRIRPQADAHARELEVSLAEHRARGAQIQKDLDEQNRKMRELEDRVRAEQESRRHWTAPEAKPPPPKPVPRDHKERATAPAPCTCDPHDPLCGCFAPR